MYHKNLYIKLHFQRKRPSILHLDLSIFSITISNKILFDTKEFKIESDTECTTFEKYKKAIAEYLDEFIDLEKKKVSSQMELLRFYFKINSIEMANALRKNA